MFFMLAGFGILAVMRGVASFIVLFFILPAIEVIPYFGAWHIGE